MYYTHLAGNVCQRSSYLSFTQGQFINVNASFQEYALALASTLAKVGVFMVSRGKMPHFYK